MAEFTGAAAPAERGYVSGRFYPTLMMAMTEGAVPAVDLVYLYPFRLRAPAVIASLVARVVTAGTGSAMKAAIWADDAATQRPTGLPVIAFDAGVATTAVATLQMDTTDTLLQAGWYWVGTKHTGTLPSMVAAVSAQGDIAWANGSTTTAGASIGSSMPMAWSVPDAYANALSALNLTSATFTEVGNASIPHVGFGIA